MRAAQWEFGYYLYQGRVFFNKFDIFEVALAQGDLAPAFEFKFHVPDLIADCTVEPETPLVDLYRARAAQLREQFDYLILMYSGGADATQVLMTFLNSGIHLDEVCTFYPLRFTERLSGTPARSNPLALLHEYRLAALPGLRQLSLCSPRTRISVVDTTGTYLGDMPAWTNCFSVPRPSGGLHGLFHALRAGSMAVELQRRADAINRKVAVIYGSEKPYMRLIGDELSFFFSDAGRVGIQNLWQHGDQALFCPVMFYWGDPMIVLKQVHTVKHALENSPAAVADIRRRKVNVYLTNNIPGLHPGLIYPDWDGRYQQLDKGCDEAILPAFLGTRPAAIAAERDRYYNDRYGRLATITPLTGNAARVRLSESLTRLYSVGPLAERSLCAA
jgi:hypothetical protein